MSTKLLRRLLQHTTNDTGGLKNKDETGNKKRKKQQEEEKPLDKDEMVNRHVQSMLLLDSTMNLKASARTKQSEKRIRAKIKRDSKIRRNTTSVALGNSRGSSSNLRLKPEPTFDKKKYQKRKEAKRLKSIAKLLKQTSSKKK